MKRYIKKYGKPFRKYKKKIKKITNKKDVGVMTDFSFNLDFQSRNNS